MMPKDHPVIPLAYDWDLGENIKPGMDQNLKTLGAVCQIGVQSKSSDAPDDPQNGDMYIHNGDESWPEGESGDVMARIEGEWVAFTPRLGWLAYVSDDGELCVYDDGWAVIAST